MENDDTIKAGENIVEYTDGTYLTEPPIGGFPGGDISNIDFNNIDINNLPERPNNN